MKSRKVSFLLGISGVITIVFSPKEVISIADYISLIFTTDGSLFPSIAGMTFVSGIFLFRFAICFGGVLLLSYFISKLTQKDKNAKKLEG